VNNRGSAFRYYTSPPQSRTKVFRLQTEWRDIVFKALERLTSESAPPDAVFPLIGKINNDELHIFFPEKIPVSVVRIQMDFIKIWMNGFSDCGGFVYTEEEK
jgi:hypothetical protein